jgi:hypothetical protein
MYTTLIEVIIHDSSNFIYNKLGEKIGINKDRIFMWLTKNKNKFNLLLPLTRFDIDNLIDNLTDNLIKFDNNFKSKKKFWDIEAQIYQEE